MTAADQDIRDLTDRLGLVDHRQDWGIGNADAHRVGEFIQCCRTKGLTDPQQYALGELVLASMNEALADGLVNGELTRHFEDFLTLNLHGLAAQIRYWASLPDFEEFPVAALLNRVATPS